MAAICAGVLPRPRTTSGNPWRSGAMVVDAGEPQIFVRAGPQRVHQLGMRRGRIDLAAGHLFEQIQELFV